MNKSTVNAFSDNSANGQRVQMIIQPKAPDQEPAQDNTPASEATSGDLNNQ